MPVYINAASIAKKTAEKIKEKSDDDREIEMIHAALILEEMIYEHAAAESVPSSVLANIAELSVSWIRYNRNRTRATLGIDFTTNAYRPSLMGKHGPTGDGVDNIVKLFNYGYDASSKVYGIWEHSYNLGRIPSRQSRDGLFFIEGAISRFNDTYGGIYHCYAYVPYDEEE